MTPVRQPEKSWISRNLALVQFVSYLLTVVCGIAYTNGSRENDMSVIKSEILTGKMERRQNSERIAQLELACASNKAYQENMTQVIRSLEQTILIQNADIKELLKRTK